MTFQTVYEISLLNSTVLQAFFFLLVGILIGVIAFKKEKGAKRTFGLMWALAWCSIWAIVFLATFRASYRYVQLLRNRHANVAEGVVRVEHVQPAEGHSYGDRIRIGDHFFKVDYYEMRIGYTKSISHGGVLAEGVYSRVFYSGDDIIRIDIVRR